MDSQDQVCPVCGQPVVSVVRRHKTLGAWVPVWGPGPCRNPHCAEYTGPPSTREQSPPRPAPQSPPPESAGGDPEPVTRPAPPG
ncbi:hypothetical protein ABZ357_15040 [Streptomyces sp. NPDC005917]|uniref:hypothetical protein n=1 Tax=unclassified Streptomyces TaxID=2593676 RepID=UPI0033DC01AE